MPSARVTSMVIILMILPNTRAGTKDMALGLLPPSPSPGGLMEVTEGGIESGKFLCNTCNGSKDCGDIASRGRRQQDTEWRLWRSDGRYKNKTLNNMKVCLRKWMLGCNGPLYPEVCNSYTEVCTASEALYHEAYRLGPHEICSTYAYMSPASVTLIITIPVFLCCVSLLSVLAALHHAFANGLCQCPPQASKLPIMLCSVTLIVFSFLTFFSPYFTCGVVGVFIAVIALISHSVSASLSGTVTDYDQHDHTERAQKWLFFATVATFVLVYSIWGAGYPNRAGLGVEQLGKECADFYNFFLIDQRLMGPAHNKEIKYWGYCEREYVADTIWNVTAVIWLGFLLGGIHLYRLGSISFSRQHPDDSPDDNFAVAGGPGTFLVDRQHHSDLTSVGRQRVKHELPSVQSYTDIRLMVANSISDYANIK
eukprot:TRINITY_DN1684_c1_g1_i1.p1 TRINITY_DN1684_c1_g1~~TRINITY_DN1684_c1_g1_i1.p1  ORF type:complete len:465 (+),score=62.57 TRINITY_DN1684_c1_g1_i1:126-1397(+)